MWTVNMGKLYILLCQFQLDNYHFSSCIMSVLCLILAFGLHNRLHILYQSNNNSIWFFFICFLGTMKYSIRNLQFYKNKALTTGKFGIWLEWIKNSNDLTKYTFLAMLCNHNNCFEQFTLVLKTLRYSRTRNCF